MAYLGREERSGIRRGRGVPAQPRRSLATWLLLLVALVLILDGIAGERGWFANRTASAQYRQAVRALDEARARNAVLREEARRLREDPAAVEDAARRQLGLIKPGEKLFIVRDAPRADK